MKRCDVCGRWFADWHPVMKRCSKPCRKEGQRRTLARYFATWYPRNRKAVIRRVVTYRTQQRAAA